MHKYCPSQFDADLWRPTDESNWHKKFIGTKVTNYRLQSSSHDVIV
jgi:hypothetical protein